MKKFLIFLLILSNFAFGSDQMAKETRQNVSSTAISLNALFTIDTTWSTGYQVTVTLSNPSNSATTNWSCSFSLPPNQTMSSLWNGVDFVSGQNHIVTNPPWIGGGVIPAQGSTTFGMIIQNPLNGLNALLGLSATANGGVPQPPVPTAPTLNKIVLNPGSTNTYTLHWNAVSNATSYTLQQSLNANFSSPLTLAQGTILSYTVNNQRTGTYYYRVNASNSAGTSSFSNVQAITIAKTSLNAPVLSAISNTNQSPQFTIHWSSIPNASGYILQQSHLSNFSNAVTVYTGPNTSYITSNLPTGTYYYRVIAYAGSVQSSPSNIEMTTVVNTQPQPSLKIPFVESYWESWNSKDSIATIVGMKADVISIAFATFTPTGNHTFNISGIDADPATLTAFIQAAHNAGKKVKISIGGATYGLSRMLLTTADAVGMANALNSFVRNNQLDGVDLDIEDYPAASLQIVLIQNLRNLLGNSALISYTPKTPASTTAPYNQVIRGAHSYLTNISFMAYDYGPGYTYQQDVQNLLSFGIPASKIAIGLMPGIDDLGKLTSLSDIQAAAHYVVQNKLGGIMFWDLNRDHENLTGLGADAATNTAWHIFNP